MQTRTIPAADGTPLAVHIAGEGPPVLMLHGFLASARLNWFDPGVAQAVIDAGRQVIAPDLRGHGQSGAPAEPRFWPRDVLAADVFDLAAALGLKDGAFDLVGYSLGARTAVRALARGLRPRRVALGGMGASGVMEAGARAAMFEDSIRHGEQAKDPRAGRRIQRMIAERGLSAEAMLGVLAAFQETTAEEIAAIEAPVLVVCGQDDRDNGDPAELARLLPNGTLKLVPGDHLSAVGTPELAAAVAGWVGV